jgi:hypothetical protein
MTGKCSFSGESMCQHVHKLRCCRGAAKITPGDIRIAFARLARFGPYKTLLAQQSLGSIFWVTCLAGSKGANATNANDEVFVVSGCPPVGTFVSGPALTFTAAATVEHVEEADAKHSAAASNGG